MGEVFVASKVLSWGEIHCGSWQGKVVGDRGLSAEIGLLIAELGIGHLDLRGREVDMLR